MKQGDHAIQGAHMIASQSSQPSTGNRLVGKGPTPPNRCSSDSVCRRSASSPSTC